MAKSILLSTRYTIESDRHINGMKNDVNLFISISLWLITWFPHQESNLDLSIKSRKL